MKLIIDIPDDVYDECKGDVYFPDTGGILWEGVRNGVPLPKAENHGFIAVCDSMDAITQEVANELKNTVFVGDENCRYCFDIMEIIEADSYIAEHTQ